jgi:hypothetical protein
MDMKVTAKCLGHEPGPGKKQKKEDHAAMVFFDY